MLFFPGIWTLIIRNRILKIRTKHFCQRKRLAFNNIIWIVYSLFPNNRKQKDGYFLPNWHILAGKSIPPFASGYFNCPIAPNSDHANFSRVRLVWLPRRAWFKNHIADLGEALPPEFMVNKPRKTPPSHDFTDLAAIKSVAKSAMVYGRLDAGFQTKARCSCRALSPLMLPAQRWQMTCVGLTSGS